MGAAVGARLVEHGVEVWTVLAGRSPASAARAEAAGMLGVDARQIGAADVVLSIVPPGEAVALARSLSPVMRETARKPIYADCNAVSPQTVAAIAAEVGAAGARFVDAGIIGGPPKPGTPGPLIYTSGPHAPALGMLAQHGLRISDRLPHRTRPASRNPTLTGRRFPRALCNPKTADSEPRRRSSLSSRMV